jgi:hypothetical protein
METKQLMDSQYGEDMFDPEDIFDIDMEDVYHIPMDMVVHLQNKTEPIFAQHVFFFDKKDPIASLEELMNFTSTWWSTISEDKNVKFIYLSDSSHNKKAIAIANVVAVSFITPEKPEWMQDGKDDTDSD